MSDAGASGSEPRRQPQDDRYLQIERRCKDLIVYANVMVKQFPKREKYQMAARIMGLCYDLLELPRAMAYLSHAKDTQSLSTVARIVATEAPQYRPEIRAWWRNHAA